MRIRMRGCRGSTPVPGTDTVRYGGNTTCIEVTTNAGEKLLFDAGTGIRKAGLDLMQNAPVAVSIFVSHTHWDHIQGLPFFVPLFVPGSKVDFYGGTDPVYRKNLREILAQQMQYCYFPVRENELKADITYTTLAEGETVRVGSAEITTIVLNHPVLNYGYRVTADGGTFLFTGDYEPPINIYSPDDEEYEDYQEMIDARRENVVSFVKGIDALICDAQYTVEEYPEKVGWGHGTFDSCLELADRAGVGRLYLTHHDPMRTDDQLDAIYADILARRKGLSDGPEVIMAHEGLEFEVGAPAS